MASALCPARGASWSQIHVVTWPESASPKVFPNLGQSRVPATFSVPPCPARVRALGPSRMAAGSWSGRDIHCDVTGRGFFWLRLRDRKTDWRGVAGKGRGFVPLWLLFAVGQSRPGEREHSESQRRYSPLGQASALPPLAKPVLGRCHPRGYRSGAAHPFLPRTRRGSLLSPCTWAPSGRPGAHLQLPSLSGRRTRPGSAGNPSARPGEPGLRRPSELSAALPGPA